ncbi:hypothetical protein NDU88_002258 [Pleurodeles waltl]|uniref:Uncharacterized protein n=1 Tax=Pleurodeles waltl TaxID=8319 RepID=A0AAV7M014_PLEWA|nr:hypothetical protein NDU88_002258 [Pleurodeles waltl]
MDKLCTASTQFSGSRAYFAENGASSGSGTKDGAPSQPDGVTLDAIYQEIMAHREETSADSSKAQAASRKLQGVIRRVAKTRSEFSQRMAEAENRVSTLECEVALQSKRSEVVEQQMIDTKWKLEDFVNRLKRNILRVLGVPEGTDMTDSHKFIIDPFQAAFPELAHWKWDLEVQTAQRYPFKQASRHVQDPIKL